MAIHRPGGGLSLGTRQARRHDGSGLSGEAAPRGAQLSADADPEGRRGKFSSAQALEKAQNVEIIACLIRTARTRLSAAPPRTDDPTVHRPSELTSSSRLVRIAQGRR
jgi:hypothetical protein